MSLISHALSLVVAILPSAIFIVVDRQIFWQMGGDAFSVTTMQT